MSVALRVTHEGMFLHHASIECDFNSVNRVLRVVSRILLKPSRCLRENEKINLYKTAVSPNYM